MQLILECLFKKWKMIVLRLSLFFCCSSLYFPFLSFFSLSFLFSAWLLVLLLQDSYVRSGTVLHNFAHIFDLLSRLRQAVDHPYLLIHGSLQSKEGCRPLPTDSRNEQETGVCAVCQEDIDKAVSIVYTACAAVALLFSCG